MEKVSGSAEQESEHQHDSYEFIDSKVDINNECESETVAVGKSGKSTPSTSDKSLDSEVRLSPKETFLANRVRELQHENENLKKAVILNGDALKLCVTELNAWKVQQNKSHNSWCEKYELARTTVTKLQEENESLKEEIKVSLAPSLHAKTETTTESCDGPVSSQGEAFSVEMFNKNVGSLEDHVNEFLSLSDEDRQKLALPTFLQDLAQICEEIQRGIRQKTTRESQSYEQALSEETVLCNGQKEQSEHLEQEKLKWSGAEKKNSELEKRVEAQPNTCKDCVGFKEQICSLRDQYVQLKKFSTNHEGSLINQREEALMNQKSAEGELLKVHKEKSDIETQLKDAMADNEFLNDEIRKKDDMIEQRQLEMSMGTKMSEKANHQIETLKSQVLILHEEIQDREQEADDWRVKEHEYQESFKRMDVNYAKTNEDLRISQSALIETRHELASIYEQREKLEAENKLLRGASGVEISEYQSKVDNLTAQLLSAEEMVENKDQDYRKLQQEHANLTSELETFPLLREQLGIFQRDFESEKEAKKEYENECRCLKENLVKIQAENERLMEELNDPTGSRMAELQKRHGGGGEHNTFNAFYDNFLAPRGPPSRSSGSPQLQSDDYLRRQVSGGCCPKCERAFPNLDQLQTHVVQCLESDNNSGGMDLICPKCQQTFPDLDTLQIHVMECLDN